jgi:DNA gyrase subunit A
MGRSSSGVKGIDLGDAIVIGAEVVEPGHYILIVTENGYGKQTVIDEYRLTHRGSKGVKALNVTEKNGMIASLKCLSPDAPLNLMIITNSGIIIKLPLEQVSLLKRATQGVRLINLKDDQKVSTVALVLKEDSEDENQEQADASLLESVE